MKKRFKNILTKSPKKNGLLLCVCTICITLISGMLIGCSAMKNELPEETVQTVPTSPSLENNAPAQTDAADDSSTDIASVTSDMQNASVENPPEQPVGSEESTYKSILLGKSDFTCTDLGNERLNISGIGRAVTDDDSITVSATRFSSVDVDGDGEDEVVLWLQINNVSDYGFEILHNINGEIYGYTLQYRTFMNLKKDGTFLFSGGAADSGIGKLSFSETGYRVNTQAYSQSGYDSNNELTVQYFINDESCSEDEFNGTLGEQDQKPDVEWVDMSENNINAILK